MRTSPIGSSVWSSISGTVWDDERHGLDARVVLLGLGFEVSRVQAGPRVSLSACCLQIRIQSSKFMLQRQTHLLPTRMMVD